MGLRKYVFAIVGFAVAVAAVVAGEWLQAGSHKNTGLELIKSGVQLAVLAVIGAAIIDFWKRLEESRAVAQKVAAEKEAEKRRVNEYRLSVLRSVSGTYHQVKAVRRLLPALGLNLQNLHPMSSDEVDVFRKQLILLNDAQLRVERLKRELESWKDSLSTNPQDQDDALGLLRRIEKYIRGVVKNWQSFGANMRAGVTPHQLLSQMGELARFLGSSSQGFECGIADPMRRLEALIRKNILPAFDAAPSAIDAR